MFTDLVGSRRLRTTTGDDAVDLRLDADRSAVDAICAEHGGTVVKDTGDGCLVAFTSARSAIAAALALQAEPADLVIRSGSESTLATCVTTAMYAARP